MQNINATINNDDLIERIKKNIADNQDYYAILGVGVVGGIFLAKGFRRPPKIDKVAIVTEWMEDVAKSGHNLYALTNEQKELWEECFGWAVRASQSMRVGLPDVLVQMTKDYRHGAIPGPGWKPPLV